MSRSRPNSGLLNRICVAGAAALVLLLRVPALRAAITLSGDPPYPMDAVVFTVDPEGKDTNQRGITTTRALRQTFQNPTTFDVGMIVAGIDVDAGAPTAGLQIRFYEVDDVFGNWMPGNLVKQFIIPTVPAELSTASTMRLGIELTGEDVFTLPQRNSGATGYGIEYSNNDGASVFGLLRHTSTAATSEDYYMLGRYLTETGMATSTATPGLRSLPRPASNR
jgi:hypothetical protein